MLRRILVALGWAAGCLAGLCVVLYLVAVAVNRRDVEPSAAALRLADRFRDRPQVRDEDNGFVYAMGFEARLGESPLQLGAKRIGWLRQSAGKTKLDLAADPLRKGPDPRPERHPALTAYFEACGPGGSGCDDAFDAARRQFDDWRDPEAELLERYRTLLGFAGWHEFVSGEPAAPMPAYGRVMNGQRLLMLHARLRAASGDAAGARELLEEDLRFWRGVLASSDLLISKMIAAAAVRQHFMLGADVLRELPPERVLEALPEIWLTAISDTERSMQRVVTGDCMYASGVIRQVDPALAGTWVVEDTGAGRSLVWLSAPLFQPQDTINLYAEFCSRALELLSDVPLADVEVTAKRATELVNTWSREWRSPRSLYNILGRMIVGYGPDFGSYVRRLGDIEGVRRAALAAVSLHEGRVTRDDIPSALAASQLRNPYDGEPFAWDASDDAIVFHGLEPGERGEHRIR